jgi:hypothetical protein
MPDISKIRYDGAYQFKKDTYEIKIKDYGIRKFHVQGEWLNGKPHGLCIVTRRGYKGIMTFTHGVSDGPGWLDELSESIHSFTKYDSEGEFDFGLERYYNDDEESESYVTSRD